MKALRAVIGQPDIGFELLCTEYDDPFGPGDPFRRDGYGYRSYSQQLGLNTWHMVLVSKRPGFLPSIDDETLWRELNSPRFTTPVLRQWVSYLKERLQENYYGSLGIREAAAWGCAPGVLTAATGQLDTFVTEGIQNGSITI